MATVVSGPRLGPPRAKQFGVWIRVDNSADKLTLQYREAGDTTWLNGDASTADGTKRDTVVLNTPATLQPSTKYEYRILDDDGITVLSSSSTWTMPEIGGQFVMCVISDGHGTNDVCYPAALTRFETVYEPQGIPMFILQGGDIDEYGAVATVEAAGDILEVELADAASATARIPLLYRPDDHDSYGNNCSKDYSIAFTSEPDHIVAGLELYDWYWRDQPVIPISSANMGVATEVCGVPIICPDIRTFKTPQTGLNPGPDGVLGNYTFDPDNDAKTFLGKEQRDWIISWLNARADRPLVFFHTSDVWQCQIREYPNAVTPPLDAQTGQRDSIGLFWKPERNYLVQQLSASLRLTGNMVWLMGDDHRNAVWRTHYDVPVHVKDNGLYPAPAIDLVGWSFIIRSGATERGVGGSNSIFGSGTVIDMNRLGGFGANLYFEITVGRKTTMRATYRDPADDSIRTGETGLGPIPAPNVGREADWHWEDGHFTFMDEYTAQYYPPDNGKYGVQFQRSFMDDLAGVVSRGVMRDQKGRLVSWEEDLVDKPDAADERQRWDGPRRVEIPWDPP